MTRESVVEWVEGYLRLWRTEGTDQLGTLFTEDVSYRTAPLTEPTVGLDALAVLWERERDGHEEPFTYTYEVVAVEGDRAVTVADAEYHAPGGGIYRDLWVLTFAEDGRCRDFEEWYWTPE
jgi:hypothetical protein